MPQDSQSNASAGWTAHGERRAAWQRKAVLRAVYDDYYDRIAERCSGTPTLEIGAASGGLSERLSDVVAMDIHGGPAVEVIADAHWLPFASGAFANVVLFDVLHHLARPAAFFQEARRVLRPGGRVVLVEPLITPLSAPFYRYLHPEAVDFARDPLGSTEPAKEGVGPEEGNQAVATALFFRHRRRLAEQIPGLALVEASPLGLLAYPLSGGYRPWTLLPLRMVPFLLRLEDVLLPALGSLMAFRALIVMEARE